MTKEEIISAVCEVCGIGPEDLLRKTKVQDVVMARHLIAHHLYWRLTVSLSEIAQAIGMNPKSIYKNLFRNPIRNRIKVEPLLRERYNAVHEKLFPKNSGRGAVD